MARSCDDHRAACKFVFPLGRRLFDHATRARPSWHGPARQRRLIAGRQTVQRAGARLSAGVTLKCLPHEKSAWGEITTELICLPWPQKVCPLWDCPSEKSHPAVNLQVKICPPGGRRTGWIFAEKLSAGGDFAEGRFYNGAVPADGFGVRAGARLSAWAIMRGHYVGRESYSFSGRLWRTGGFSCSWSTLTSLWRHFRSSSRVQLHVADDSSSNIRTQLSEHYELFKFTYRYRKLRTIEVQTDPK